MEKKALSTLHMNHLTINDSFSLFKTTIDLARSVQSELSPMLMATLNKLSTDNDSFGEQINKNSKNVLTDKLNAMDVERDGYLNDIKRTVSFYMKGRDLAKKNASDSLYLFLTPYWNAATLALNSETGVVFDLIAKYKANVDVNTAAQILGLTEDFSLLEEINTALDSTYKTRNEENGGRGNSGSSLKPIATASYTHFCTALEQAASFTPTPSLLTLFHSLDELRKKYRSLVKAKVAEKVEA